MKNIKEIPIACNLEVFNQSERKLHHELLTQVMTRFQNVKELSNGYQLSYTYNDKLFKKIAEWLTLESRCCPFVNFKLELDKTKNLITLYLTGHEGVKQILKCTINGRE